MMFKVLKYPHNSKLMLVGHMGEGSKPSGCDDSLEILVCGGFCVRIHFLHVSPLSTI